MIAQSAFPETSPRPVFPLFLRSRKTGQDANRMKDMLTNKLLTGASSVRVTALLRREIMRWKLRRDCLTGNNCLRVFTCFYSPS